MYYLYLLFRSSDSRHKLDFLELGKRMYLLYKGGASRTRVTKHRDFLGVLLLSFLLHLRNTSGTRESIVFKCSKGFMELENWMLTHTHRHNHAAEFVNEGVGGPQAQHQYICRDHWFLCRRTEQKSELEKRAFGDWRQQWILNCTLVVEKKPDINLLI